MNLIEEFGLKHDILNSSEEADLAQIIVCAKNASRLLIQQKITTEQFSKLQQAAQNAREKLTLQNRRFVFSIAKQYQPNPPTTIEDLVSEGNIGLMKAIENFDPKQGRFSTYAGFYIHQAVIQFLIYQNTAITVPQWIMDEINSVKNAQAILTEELERGPTTEEIAQKVGKSEKRVQSVIDAMKCRYQGISSLHPDRDESELQIEDTLGSTPDEILVKADTPLWMQKLISDVLDKRAAKILRLYYGIGHDRSRTLREVGDLCGLTRERIRQILKEATDKLKEHVHSELGYEE